GWYEPPPLDPFVLGTFTDFPDGGADPPGGFDAFSHSRSSSIRGSIRALLLSAPAAATAAPAIFTSLSSKWVLIAWPEDSSWRLPREVNSVCITSPSRVFTPADNALTSAWAAAFFGSGGALV